MPWQISLGFIVLLLPALLALLVRGDSETNADPYVVRRARYGAMFFPVAVAIMYWWYFNRLLSLAHDSPSRHFLTPSGLYIWAVMAWFLFASLVYTIRKSVAKPFSQTTKRSATLEPRHRDPMIPVWAWLLLAASICLATVIVVIILAPAPRPRLNLSLVLLASAASVLILGLWLVNRNLLSPEPSLPGALASVQSAYRGRRRIRSWWIYSVVAISISYKVFLAVSFVLDKQSVTAIPLFSLAAVLFILVSTIFYVLDRRQSHSIVRLMSEE